MNLSIDIESLARRVVASLSGLLLAGALGAAEWDCHHRSFCSDAHDASDPRAQERIFAELGGELARLDFDLVFETLSSRFEREAGSREVDSTFDEALRAFLAQRDDEEGCSTQFFTPVSAVDATGGSTCTMFTREPFELDVEAACEEDPEAVRRIAYYADTLAAVCRLETAPARDRVLEEIQRARARWNGFLFEGFPMYPWESLLNSYWLDSETIEDVPDRQWVLLHPSVGYELDLDDFEEVRGQVAVGVELGHVWYRDLETYERWWGLAALASFRDDVGAGAGVSFRWNHLALGVTWHDWDENGDLFDDDPTLFLGVELYQKLDRAKERWKEKVEKLKGSKLSEIAGGGS